MATPLGDFVRARRNATTPESIGLPVGPRRRVPGLRRSELAERAGISVEYLVRIEQGADSNPSPSVLVSLGDALGLDASDRVRLRHLVTITDDCLGASTPEVVRSAERVRPTVLALLDQLEPAAAVVGNRLGDLLAHTRGFERLALASGVLDGARPNLTRFVFTDPRARTLFPDWDQLADEQAADLWLHPSGERALALSKELQRSAESTFNERVHGHPPATSAVMRWQHPHVGELRLAREVLDLPVADAQHITVFLPADRATGVALNALRDADGEPLRIVG